MPRFERSVSPGAYQMEHSANVMLINPRGNYHGFFRAPLDIPKMRVTLRSTQYVSSTTDGKSARFGGRIVVSVSRLSCLARTYELRLNTGAAKGVIGMIETGRRLRGDQVVVIFDAKGPTFATTYTRITRPIARLCRMSCASRSS